MPLVLLMLVVVVPAAAVLAIDNSLLCLNVVITRSWSNTLDDEQSNLYRWDMIAHFLLGIGFRLPNPIFDWLTGWLIVARGLYSCSPLTDCYESQIYATSIIDEWTWIPTWLHIHHNNSKAQEESKTKQIAVTIMKFEEKNQNCPFWCHRASLTIIFRSWFLGRK